ncbi:MAG: RNA polymerase sigma factor [Planctomycetota bacterium]
MTDPASPDVPPDATEALSRALRMGEDVLGEWYRAVFPEVRRLARGLLARRDIADDVAQDVMLHLADRIAQWNPDNPFRAWSRRAVVNRCRSVQRSARRRDEHEGAAGAAFHEGTLPRPEDAATAEELSALIDRSLDLLPPREREVFVLIDLEGSSASEAADALEITASTVRAALSMARRRLRDALAPHLAEEGLA